MQKSRSLIMCVTPLQMIIAEKIMKLHSSESFDLLVIALNDNEKYKYYYDRLKKVSLNSLYYISTPGLNGFLDYVKKLKINHLDHSYKNLYLASIDSRHFQYLVSENVHSHIYTFDDGTANIIPSSLYYLNSKPKLLKRAVWRMLGIKDYMQDIKKKSLLHYTIYKDIPNIIESQQYISLIPLSNEIHSKMKDKVAKFYLGQPLTDISEDFDLLFVKKNIDKLEIDYYYPHPREKFYPIGNYQIIQSPLIFEDYIIQFLEDNPDVNIEVFSFISTALLNIMSLDRLRVSYIHNHEIFKLYRDFYFFAEESFGIPNLDLDKEFI